MWPRTKLLYANWVSVYIKAPQSGCWIIQNLLVKWLHTRVSKLFTWAAGGMGWQVVIYDTHIHVYVCVCVCINVLVYLWQSVVIALIAIYYSESHLFCAHHHYRQHNHYDDDDDDDDVDDGQRVLAPKPDKILCKISAGYVLVDFAWDFDILYAAQAAPRRQGRDYRMTVCMYVCVCVCD